METRRSKQQRQQKAAEMSSEQGEGGSTKRVEVEGQREGEEVKEREEYVVGAIKRGRGQSKYKYKAYKFNYALANKNQ